MKTQPEVSGEKEKQIWKERIDYATRLGLCIGALKGLWFQVAPEMREKIDSILAEVDRPIAFIATMEGTK